MSSDFPAIRSVQLIACDPIKGRQCPPSVSSVPHHAKTSLQTTIETPSLPFERDEAKLKIRKPHIPARSVTSLSQVVQPSRNRHGEGTYAMRFDDATWGHSAGATADHYASRREIQQVGDKFDALVGTIVGENEVEQAGALQSATDMLMDEVATMLRAECREQCELVERARVSYAAVFAMLQNDAAKLRQLIEDLEKQKAHIEENLTKVIDNAAARVKEAQSDCDRQVKDMQRDMDDKKEEYDNSMKRFLEQKGQLEEHVQALHKVFLDFQSDSVYLTMEELKQRQEKLEKKLKNRDEEIIQLNEQIAHLQKVIQEGEKQRGLLDDANTELRRELQTVRAAANRLQRRLEMQNIDAGGEFQDIDMDGEIGENGEEIPGGPLISSEAVQDSTGKFGKGRNMIDTTPYFTVMQNLSLIADRIHEVVSKNSDGVLLPQTTAEETDKAMMSGAASVMIKAIMGKTQEVLQAAECLDSLDIGLNETGDENGPLPRFLELIKGHNQVKHKRDLEENISAANLLLIRQIMNSKYLSDKMNARMARPLTRFPEFVVGYFCKDGENIFTGLSKSARMWRAIEGSQLPEVKLFRNFLLEKLTVDELSFFLEARNSLIGFRTFAENDPQEITIEYAKCDEFATAVIGAFSPVLATVKGEASKFAVNGYIDYSQFLTVLIAYYQNERRRRRTAVKLMFKSKSIQNPQGIDFETFISMIQSLGFQGSIDDIFALFREACLLGGGSLSVRSFTKAMDSLSFHFYSIEIPLSITRRFELTELTRQQLLRHWVKFSAWFNGFKVPIPQLDSWFRAQLVAQVRRVEQLFKTKATVASLYSEYRQLLDYFQFGLDVLARSQKDPMPKAKSERHLLLLENMIDLLITFIVKDCAGAILFTETVL